MDVHQQKNMDSPQQEEEEEEKLTSREIEQNSIFDSDFSRFSKT